MKSANINGFSVIRILQEDVLENKFNWQNEIIITITKILNENKVQNIFICKNDEYNKYQKMF